MGQATNTPAISSSSRAREDHHVVASDGTSLAVSRWSAGPAATGTAVFLHGLCLNSRAWNVQIRHVLQELGDTTTVLAYDHRGHGDSASASARTYRVDQLAEDLDHVLSALDVSGPVTLIGHSLGAMVALAYLDRTQHTCTAPVRGLVLCATAAGRIAEHGIGRLLETPILGRLVGLADHVPARTTGIMTGPVRAALHQLHSHGDAQYRALARVTSTALATTPLRTAVGFLPSLRDFDQHHSLGAIRATTTILSGGGDVLTPLAHSEAMAAAIPGATHVHVPGVGHMIPQLAPRIVNDAVRAVIAAASRRPALPAARRPAIAAV